MLFRLQCTTEAPEGLVIQPSPPETQIQQLYGWARGRALLTNSPVIMLLAGDCILNSKYTWHKVFKHGV